MSRRSLTYGAGAMIVLLAAVSFVLMSQQSRCAAHDALFDLRSWSCVKPPPAILQREDLKRV